MTPGQSYANGQPACVLADGVLTYYYADGGLRARGPFDGRMQGDWTFWRKSGALWQTAQFVDDRQHGEVVRYARDGTVEARLHYDSGRKRPAPKA